MAKRARSTKTTKRPVQVDDLMRLRTLSDAQMSPDGGRIVFVEKQVGDKNDCRTNLWTVPTGGGPARQFTSGDRDSQPQFSRDGSQIALVRAAEKHSPQIYLIAADGGEARQLTHLPEGSIGAYRLAPDGRSLAVAFRPQAEQWTEAAKKERQEQGSSDPPRVLDDWWYRLDGDGYFDAQRYQLYVVDTATGEHRLLYAKDTLGLFSFDFSPDSKQLVVATNRDRQAMVRPWKDELVRIDLTGKQTPIPSLGEGPKTAVRWSPNGKWIAYAGRDGKDGCYSVENLELRICRPDGSDARSLTSDSDYCLLAVTVSDAAEAAFEPVLQFSPDSKRVYFQLGWHGEMHVASAPVGGGPIEVHTRGQIDLQMGTLSDDGRNMALVAGDATHPGEVAVADCTRDPMKPKKITRRNAALLSELELSKPTRQWITADDGHRVQVWTMLPPGHKTKRKLPAVLEIHGGPHAQYGSGLFHEFQTLAAAGFVVFFSNPRGSKGYGRDHCAAIRGDWGGADWIDVQAVIAHMQRHPAVDPRRMGVMGGSYGGFMTNWAIGHCRDFAAAITDRCVSNMVSMGGTSDFVIEPDRYFPGNSWDRTEARWNQSPLKYLGNAKTPTLIIHSEGDLRCNIEQGEQVFAALKLLGVPTRMVRYPRSTSHGMSRKGPPDMRMHRLEQILGWWEKYLG